MPIIMGLSLSFFMSPDMEETPEYALTAGNAENIEVEDIEAEDIENDATPYVLPLDKVTDTKGNAEALRSIADFPLALPIRGCDPSRGTGWETPSESAPS